MIMAIVTGQCHCGAFKYQVNGNLTGVVNCHCGDCRRLGRQIDFAIDYYRFARSVRAAVNDA